MDPTNQLKSLQQKSIKDLNLPCLKKMRVIDFLEKFDLSKQVSSLKPPQQKDKQILKNDNTSVNVDTSRSNSIQGRKLSFIAEPQLTVSKNTLDIDNEKVVFSHRERETLQRLSEAGIQIMSSLVSNGKHQQSGKSLNVKRKSPGKEQSQRSTIVYQERHSNQKSKKALIEEGNLYSDSVNKKNPLKDQTSFMLTFNKEADGAQGKSLTQVRLKESIKQQNYGVKQQQVVTVVNENSPNTQNPIFSINSATNKQSLLDSKETRIKLLNQESNLIKKSLHLISSSSKKKKQERRQNFSTPSPQRRHQQYIHQQARGETPYANKENSQQKKSRSQSPDRSIDRLVKDNIKKYQEKKRSEQDIQQVQEGQKKLIKIKMMQVSKSIREKNLQVKQPLQKKDINRQHQQSLNNLRKSKSPFKPQKLKNQDLPLQKQSKILVPKENQGPNKKNHDLGLEIFELKKELGMYGDNKQSVSIHQILTERNKNKKQKIKGELQKEKQQQLLNDMLGKKSFKENPQLQKLISQQKKQRLKQEKQDKILQIISQQKVLANLKTLSEITEQRRAKKKKDHARQNNNAYFKTVVQESTDNGYHNLSIQPQKHRQSIKVIDNPSRLSMGDRKRSVTKGKRAKSKQAGHITSIEIRRNSPDKSKHKQLQHNQSVITYTNLKSAR